MEASSRCSQRCRIALLYPNERQDHVKHKSIQAASFFRKLPRRRRGRAPIAIAIVIVIMHWISCHTAFPYCLPFLDDRARAAAVVRGVACIQMSLFHSMCSLPVFYKLASACAQGAFYKLASARAQGAAALLAVAECALSGKAWIMLGRNQALSKRGALA